MNQKKLHTGSNPVLTTNKTVYLSMTVKELKEKLEGLDPDMKVGGVGHFGEFLKTFHAGVTESNIGGNLYNEGKREKIFSVMIEDAGPEPD